VKAYSLDLRQKVLAAALRGDRTIREVAESFGVGATFVDKVLALHKITGEPLRSSLSDADMFCSNL
jgi:transposase